MKFHVVGTSELFGHVFSWTGPPLAPGEHCLCEVMLEAPVVAGIGDHFILRLPSPTITLGGGRLIHREADQLAPTPEALARLDKWRGAIDSPLKRVALAVGQAGPEGLTARNSFRWSRSTNPHLSRWWHRPSPAAKWKHQGRHLVHKQARANAIGKIVSLLTQFHDKNMPRSV